MKHLSLVEIAAWVIGTALFAIYLALRWWASHANLEGVTALQKLREELAAQPTIILNQATAQTNLLALPPPETSSWSQTRLRTYQDSVRRQEVPEAVLRIPTLELSVPIFKGTNERNLTRGAGHIEGTSGIGGGGNIGLAAHRDGYFRALKDVRIGQTLYLDTPINTFVYRVVSTMIVVPAAVEVLAETSTPTITLVTCYPFYFIGSAPQRFIVQAELIPAP